MNNELNNNLNNNNQQPIFPNNEPQPNVVPQPQVNVQPQTNPINNIEPMNNQTNVVQPQQPINQNINTNNTPIEPPITNPPQPTPSFQQPIMQEPTPQPVNNSFESGNANNQNLNSKPPKKMNLGLIIGIVAVIAVVGVGIFFVSKSLLSNDNNTNNENIKLKESYAIETKKALNDTEFKIIYNIDSITDEFWNSKKANQDLTNKEFYQQNFRGNFGFNQGGLLSAQPVGFIQELQLSNGLFYKLMVENNDFLFLSEARGNANTSNNGVELFVLGNDLALYNVDIEFEEEPNPELKLTHEKNWQFIKTYTGTFNDETKFIAYKYAKDDLYLKIEFDGNIRNNQLYYYLYDDNFNKYSPTYSEKKVENIEKEIKKLLIEKIAPLVSFEELTDVKEYNLRNNISDDLKSFDKKIYINFNEFKYIYLYYESAYDYKERKILWYYPQLTGYTKSGISLEINQFDNEAKFKQATFFNEYFSSKKSSFKEKDVYLILFSPSTGQTYYNGLYFEHDGFYYKINRQINTNETNEENYVNETLQDVFSFK